MRKYLLTALLFIGIWGCSDDLDDNFSPLSDVNEFVYRAMSAFYLYKEQVPVLANDAFASQGDLQTFLSGFNTPRELFDVLLYDPTNVDRFSVIVENFLELENSFAGINETTGMRFLLVRISGSDDVFGVVTYVLPNSPAASAGVSRGMIFTSVSNTPLTINSDFNALFNSNSSFSIQLAELNNGQLIATGQSIDLTKAVITENPIHNSRVIEIGTHKVGYVMYNRFTPQFDDALNTVFTNFAAQGITDLVVDLRYNPGGAVSSAVLMGSMIANQPSTSVFSTEEWNPEIQQILEDNQPDALVNNFVTATSSGAPLSPLNLNRVYIIATGSSASASELVMTALEPYLNVVHVGTSTVGKFQGSITLYDSPDFRRQGANPGHTYALQPLVFKSLNSVGFTDYFNGLTPDILLAEDFFNMGIIGDENEPLLAECLTDITGVGKKRTSSGIKFETVLDDNKLKAFGQEMYLTKPLPNLELNLNF